MGMGSPEHSEVLSSVTSIIVSPRINLSVTKCGTTLKYMGNSTVCHSVTLNLNIYIIKGSVPPSPSPLRWRGDFRKKV